MSKTPRKWSREEDKALLRQVSFMASQGKPNDWTAIAAALPDRSNKDCRKRWCNHLIGGLRKGPWDPSEDQRLAMGVQEHGQQWPLVAEEVGTRSADQCAKRWQHSLNPELDHSKWTAEEERTLLDAVAKHGRAWKEIRTQHFPGRAINNVKNRYVTLTRRRGSRAGSDSQPASHGDTPDDGTADSDSDSSADLPAGARCSTNAHNTSPDADSSLFTNMLAGSPFSLDPFAGLEASDMDFHMAATPGAFMADMHYEFNPDCAGLGAAAGPVAVGDGDHAAAAPSSMMQLDQPDRAMLHHSNSSAELVLSIENPSPETVTGVMGLLVHSNTKFRMEMK